MTSSVAWLLSLPMLRLSERVMMMMMMMMIMMMMMMIMMMNSC